MAGIYTLEFEKPLLELDRQIEELKRVGAERQIDVEQEVGRCSSGWTKLQAEIYGRLTPMQRVMVARHPRRPYTLDYLSTIFTDFIELHGDRLYRDDPAIVGGWARLDGVSVMVIGHQKGRDTKENLKRNFGMAHPEGYRKALRLMHLAAKFGAPGHHPDRHRRRLPGPRRRRTGPVGGAGAEYSRNGPAADPDHRRGDRHRGLAAARWRSGVADRILMFENSVYSVISPEGCAAILWKDATQRERAAEALKLTAQDLIRFKIIDEIIPEPLGGAHQDPEAAGRGAAGVADPAPDRTAEDQTGETHPAPGREVRRHGRV